MKLSTTRSEIHPLVILWPSALLLLLILFSNGLIQMLGKWQAADYSHGYLIPIIAFYLFLQRLSVLAQTPSKQCWTALLFLLAGLGMLLLGEFGTLFTIIHYGFWVALAGIMVAVVGLNGLAAHWGSLCYLIFMIPLPNFIHAQFR